MAFLPIAMMALQAVGTISQAEGEARQLNQQADIANANAKTVRLQSNANEETQRRENKMRLGAGRAAAAETGFQSGSGSLAGIQSSNAAELELDVLTQRYKSELESINYENEASSLKASAKSARKSGYMKAFTSLAGSAYGSFSAPRIGAPAPIETRRVN